MKSLGSIIKKYSNVEFNKENYEIGGGLSSGKFASNRHEDAKSDNGKLTFGKVCQMFKKATENDLDYVKEVINYAVPHMEWHHAGKLPKRFGGGMKKTYFLNSKEIVDIATNWKSYEEKLQISKAEKRKQEAERKSKEQLKQEFLNANANKVVRVSEEPAFFYEIDREMSGKYGWFSAYGKSYNLTVYYTGWVFDSEEKLNEFYNI